MLLVCLHTQNPTCRKALAHGSGHKLGLAEKSGDEFDLLPCHFWVAVKELFLSSNPAFCLSDGARKLICSHPQQPIVPHTAQRTHIKNTPRHSDLSLKPRALLKKPMLMS